MNNFFDEYLYKKEEYDVLQKAYQGAFGIVKSHVDDIARNTIISKTSTFKKIRFQMIDVSNALYTMSSLLNNNSVIAIMGLVPSTPYDQKLEAWSALSPSQKADILDVTGYSILLTSYSAITDSDNYSSAKFNIVDFELSDINNNHYVRNVDYVFRDNKLFILKEFSINETYTKKSLILKNITIDTNSTEDVLGVPLNIPYSDQFTKTEYNETLRSFIQAAAGGPTLANLNIALARYKTLEGVKVYDRHSAPPSKKSFWGFDGYIGELTAFDFLVALPLTFAYNSEKLDYIANFFNQIKPAYTNFKFIPQKTTTDRLILKYQKDKLSMTPVFNIPEKITHKETKKFMTFKILNDGYNVIAYRYGDDAQFFTDSGKYTDRCTANDSLIALCMSRSIKEKLDASDSMHKKPTLYKQENISVKKDALLRTMTMTFSENYSVAQQGLSDYWDNDYYDGNLLYDIFTFDDRHVGLKNMLSLNDIASKSDYQARLSMLAILDKVLCKTTVLSKGRKDAIDNISYREAHSKKQKTPFKDTLRNISKYKNKPTAYKHEKLLADDSASQKATPRIKDAVNVKKESLSYTGDSLKSDKVTYSEKYHLLNKHNPYVRIVVRKDAIANKQRHKSVDTFKTSKYTNTVYGDGIFSYDDVGGIFYDSNEDAETKSRESVTMRLIPK